MLNKIKKIRQNSNKLDDQSQGINKVCKKLMKPVTVTKLEKALDGAARFYKVDNTNGEDPLMQHHSSDISVENTLKQFMSKVKVYVTIKIVFQKPKDKGIIINSAYFNSSPQIITGKTNIYKTLGILYFRSYEI